MGVKEIPIIRLDDLTDEQRKAYALAHNKLTMNSDFDLALLDTELAEIETIDMTLLGFDGGTSKQDGVEKGDSTGTSFSYQEQYGVIVMCRNEQEQEAVFNRLTEEGYECKVVAV
jgi:hypothetical protein